MALLNYSTVIDAEQTIAEIQRMLSGHGVTALMTEFEGRQVSAVSFKISLNGQPMSFRLPCNWRSVRAVFDEQGIVRVKHRDRDLDNQAIRTAWRVVKDWIEAQLALVEINMATLPQVFLPYAITSDGRTLAEKLFDDPSRLLGPGN